MEQSCLTCKSIKLSKGGASGFCMRPDAMDISMDGKLKCDDICDFYETNLYPEKYLPDSCCGCGRVRVELWSDGQKICEKCHVNQDTKEYDRDRFKYI